MCKPPIGELNSKLLEFHFVPVLENSTSRFSSFIQPKFRLSWEQVYQIIQALSANFAPLRLSLLSVYLSETLFWSSTSRSLSASNVDFRFFFFFGCFYLDLRAPKVCNPPHVISAQVFVVVWRARVCVCAKGQCCSSAYRFFMVRTKRTVCFNKLRR